MRLLAAFADLTILEGSCGRGREGVDGYPTTVLVHMYSLGTMYTDFLERVVVLVFALARTRSAVGKGWVEQPFLSVRAHCTGISQHPWRFAQTTGKGKTRTAVSKRWDRLQLV